VPRPAGVSPRIKTPTNSKWSVQTCERGLYRGTIEFSDGSIAVKSEPLRRLQLIHAKARFSLIVLPPCLSATR